MAGEGLWPLARYFFMPLPKFTRVSSAEFAAQLDAARRLVLRKGLSLAHPTSVLFLDESGSIAFDRFFSVGCLKLYEPAALIRQLEKWKDTTHWYQEIHFTKLTLNALPMYKQVIDIVSAADCEFSCFIADRTIADPVARFGSPWKAYEKLATQLVIASVKPGEIVSVLADSYSTPNGVVFEEDLRSEVNRRLDRLAVMPVVRLDSRAATPLQIVDLLTSAVTFEFRQNAGIAGVKSPKARLARHLRERYGVGSFLQGCDLAKINVKLHGPGANRQAAPPAVVQAEAASSEAGESPSSK